MKGYEKLKYSNIERIGQIPEHWKLLKFRHLIEILTDFTANGSFADLAKNVTYLENGYSRLIRLTDLRENLKNNGIFVSEESHNYLSKSSLSGDEILLANVGAYAGLVWRVPKLNEPATLGPNMFLLKFNELLTNDFAYYTLISDYLFLQLENKAVSSAQPKLNKEDVRSCFYILPTVQEQIKIVQYLNYHTGIIDQLLSKKHKLMELLKEQRQAIIDEVVTKGLNPAEKMKDTGIEWLGEIPEHWYVSRFNRGIDLLTDYEANGSFDSIKKNVEFTDDKGYAWYVRATDLENGNINDEDKVRWVNESTYNFLVKTSLIGKELLIAKRGEIGKVYLMPETPYKATLAPNLYLVRLNEKLNPNFTWYYFESSFGKNQLVLKNRSVTIGAIYKDDLKEIDTVYPPYKTQLEIVDYLNSECEKINIAISAISSQIEKLKEYRQSIISEAVTGKVDVRNWQPPVN